MENVTGKIAQRIYSGATKDSLMNACVKQEVYAMIIGAGIDETDKSVFGGNFMQNREITECPRVVAKYETGEGYHLCKEKCGQLHHAESDVISRALREGVDMVGSTLYLIGHTYCCDSCLSKMREAGIKDYIILDKNDSFIKQDSL